MAFYGMDVPEVRQTGQLMQQISGQIEDLMRQIDGRVRSTSWLGPDADRFKNDWWPKHQATLKNIATELHGLGQSALNNAQEQDDISK